MDQQLIKAVPLEDLSFWEKNYRGISDENLAKLKRKISEIGVFKPLLAIAGVTPGTYQIIAGNQRLKAYKALGYEAADILFFPNLTDKKLIAKIAIADNQSDGFTIPEKLTVLLEDAGIALDELDDFCFSDDELAALEPAAEDEDLNKYDAAPALADTPAKTQPGDIIQLGRHTLICGDSTNPETLASLMYDKTADFVLTDPPYGMHLKTDFTGMGHGNKYKPVIGDNKDFKPELITSIFENFKDCKEIFTFGPDYYAKLLPEGGAWLVWDKREGLEDAEYSTASFELIFSKAKHRKDILRCQWFGMCGLQKEPEGQKERCHPTQKPVRLLVDILRQYAQGAQNIVDLYGGSGSTLIACELEGKTCFIAELDPAYCDVIVKRFLALNTGAECYLSRGGVKMPIEEAFGEV